MAYCLMTNHVHLLAVPESERSLGNPLNRSRFARLVEKPGCMAWSSARARVGLETSPVLDGEWWKQRRSRESWAAVHRA